MMSAGGCLRDARASSRWSGADGKDERALVEELADGLHLRQDEAAFWRLDVLRHDEEYEIAFLDEAVGDLWLFAQGIDAGELVAQGVHVLAPRDIEGKHVVVHERSDLCEPRWIRRAQVAFADDGDDGRVLLLEMGEPFFLVGQVLGIKDDDGDVDFLRGLGSARKAQAAEVGGFVVKTGGVQERAWAEAMELDVFLDDVGGGAGLTGETMVTS